MTGIFLREGRVKSEESKNCVTNGKDRVYFNQIQEEVQVFFPLFCFGDINECFDGCFSDFRKDSILSIFFKKCRIRRKMSHFL